MEITLRKQEWRVVKSTWFSAQLWFGLVFRYEFLSVSFFATDFSPGRATYFFLETNLKRMNMHASNDFHYSQVS